MNLKNLLKSLVNIDSTTGNEREICDFLARYFDRDAIKIEKQEVNGNRYNLFIKSGHPEIVLSSHLDTVRPFFPFSEDNTFFYGRGACDAKGCTASQIVAFEKMIQAGRTNLGLLYVVGEEGGSDGAKAANGMANDCRYLINGEPTENRLATGTKGAFRLEIHTSGKTAHSAYPEKGESAIEKLLSILMDLKKTNFPTDPIFGDTYFNIGLINGGIQANVVPDSAFAELMFRIVRDSESLEKQIVDIIQDRAKIKIKFKTNPVRLLTFDDFEQGLVSYATDIPLLPNWGQPLLLGPGSILDAHTSRECIRKTELEQAVDLYCRLINRLSNG